MQKRVVYNFNAQTATESAAEHSTDKAVKTSNAIGKIKRAFSGKSFKLVVLIVLLFASLFCTIGSADWIISQQKVVPNVAGNSIFKFDDLGLGAHVNNGKPTENYTFNGSSISISMSAAAVGGVQNLPDSAIEAQNIRYRVKKCAPDTKPENLSEEFFNSGYTTILPTDAGTYAVLITSEAGGVSYGKTIKVFTIAPCPVKIDWAGAVDFTYDGTDHSSNITATAKTENGAAVNENIFKISFSYKAHGATTFTPVTEVKNAGTYTATAEISNNNYTISSNEAATFTIEQKALTVTAEDKTVTYGDSATYTATYNGLLDCDKGKLGTPNFTCNYNKVGTYSITVDGLENSNYAITYVNGTLTVNKRTVTLDWGTGNSFIYDGNAHTLNPAAKNIVIGDDLVLDITVTGENISGSSAINVGTYTATAQIANENYVIDENNKSATFTITARALTITAKDNSITYGDKPSAKGYEISGFANNENESVITGLDSITYTFDYNQYDNIYNGTEKLKYYITPEIKGLSAKNYTFLAEKGNLTVNKLPLTFADNAVISRKYTKNGISFSKDLFNAAEDNKNTTCYFKSTGATLTNDILNNIYKDVSTATSAINFSGEKDTTKPENGFYSYTTFNDKITAGSTYLISGVQLNDYSNFYLKLGSNSIYLKYCTAKIGDVYYTIEDAINSTATGDIILASNSSGTDTYVISAFTSLNYYGNKTFACSKNIIVPHTDGATTYENQKTGQTGNVGSVLIIPNGVSLTMNSSSLNILAVISQNNTTNTCTSSKRGVVMNQGTLTVKNQIKSGKNIVPNVLAYGYLKGNGNVHVENGATVQDLFHLYDFKGGGLTYGIYDSTKEYLPINSYSIHNVSCNVRVNAGCVYNTYYEITIADLWFSGIIPVVSTADSAALFKLSSGYIEKRAIPAESTTWKNKKDSTGITYGESLDKIEGSNQLAGQKEDIRIFGTAVDGAIEINIKVLVTVSMKTGTNNPLPVPYMDIRVCNGGDLSLVNSSYKFMPGSSLTVDDGGKLTLGANAKLVLYSVEDCSVLEAPATYKEKDGTIKPYPYSFITRYCIDKVDAYFLINSNNVTLNGGVSGQILSEKSGIKLVLNRDLADITVLNVIHDSAKKLLLVYDYADITTRNASTARPMKPCGNTINSSSTLNPGSYISTQGQDGNYYWIISDQLKTITFKSDSAVLKTLSVILEKNNDTLVPYTITAEDLPNEPIKQYYTFDGWYMGDSKLVPGTTTITDNTVFTAKWIPNKYNIEYVHIGCTDEQLATITSDNPTQYTYNEKLVLNTPTSTNPELNFMGWFSNKECTTPITEIAIGTHGNTTVYGKWTTEQLKKYTITYESGLDGVTLNITTVEATGFASGFTYKIPTTIKATWDGKTANLSPDFMNSTDLSKLVEEHHYNFSKYFAGWYIYATDGKTLLDTIYETCPTIEKAEDIILIPIWKAKTVLQVSFADSEGSGFVNGNNTFGQKTKYFKPGCSISSVIISAACSEYTTNICDFMGEQYQFTKYSTAQGDDADIVFPSDDGAIVDITAIYTRYYYINISGNGISLTGSNPYIVEPNTTSFKISDKVTLSEGYEIKSYTINGVNSNSDTINLRNYDPYAEINIVVNTQRVYTVRYDKGSYSSAKLTVTCNGETVPFGSSVTCHYNDKLVITTSKKWGAIVTNADTNEQIGTFGSSSVETKEYSVTSNIIITQTDDDSVCIAAGTLISLYDGTKKKVEDLTSDDWILTFNHETGKLDKAKLLTNAHSGMDWKYYSVINLRFSNNSTFKVIREHGFFDLTLNKYVYINETNYNQYIGHKFYSAQWDGNTYSKKEITLEAAFIATEYTTIFSPVTEYTLNIFTEEVLSITTEIGDVANVFSFDENMKYNENEMNTAIDKYGLTSYEDLKDIVSFELYKKLPLKYYNIYIEKGLITKEKIQEIIQKYLTQ